MRLPDPHSAVTSQQQLDRVTGTVQKVLEVELQNAEMGLALWELDIECYVSSYNPSYNVIAQALHWPAKTDDITEDEENDEGCDEDNVGEDGIGNLRVLCWYHPLD